MNTAKVAQSILHLKDSQNQNCHLCWFLCQFSYFSKSTFKNFE